MANKKKIYWDTCVWLSLINEEPGREHLCRYVIKQARAGSVEIWTAALTMAEAFKKNCEGHPFTLPENKDLEFEKYIEQEFFVIAQVDLDIGTLARRLLRLHPELKKPTDAVHLACALMNNVDEMHTFDARNLLALSEKVTRNDGVALIIRTPPEDPAGDLFDTVPSVPAPAGGAY